MNMIIHIELLLVIGDSAIVCYQLGFRNRELIAIHNLKCCVT